MKNTEKPCSQEHSKIGLHNTMSTVKISIDTRQIKSQNVDEVEILQSLVSALTLASSLDCVNVSADDLVSLSDALEDVMSFTYADDSGLVGDSDPNEITLEGLSKSGSLEESLISAKLALSEERTRGISLDYNAVMDGIVLDERRGRR